MLRHTFFMLAFGALTAVASHAAGFAHNENFVVYCPVTGSQQEGQQLATSVLQYADSCRAEIAKQWLGSELPPGVGRTVINIDFAEARDTAMTWAKDDPSRRYHSIYLTTSPDKVLGSTLKHELTHAVLATRWQHPNRLPAWAEEGVASRYDDEGRIATRAQLIQWFSDTGNWPQLERLLEAKTISAQSTENYAAAASLTDFLLEKADKATFFEFALAGTTEGWDSALTKHYNIRNVAELQTQWQARVTNHDAGIKVAARR